MMFCRWAIPDSVIEIDEKTDEDLNKKYVKIVTTLLFH